ncbi:PREDICTED: taste receptor type 2 member 9-like [Elephantulus edwardii]|uniref:taste receptor type 2 member 9-like n=1 Tax=Elephantulus edwardii TaxID=28737 RepID=UPI0003F09D6A|nr:PREDICTED: taste receptor type 2 member 9-like [Elephantulus edwardii]
MPSATEVIYMILLSSELAIGIWGNGFIVLVNFFGCLRRRDISLVDTILVSLAISRISLLCVISLDGFIMVLFPNVYTHGEIMSVLDIFWTLTNHLSVWFTSCLSIFYLLKISNVSCSLSLWLKINIKRVILGILLGSFLITLLICIPMSYYLHDDFRYQFKDDNGENKTLEFEVSKILNALQQIFLNLGALVPFVLSLISFLLLLFSLFRHTKNIKFHATGSRDPSTEAHMRAIKTVVIFLLLFIISYTLFLVVTSSFLIPQRKLVVMFGGIITIIFPSGHSFILIMGNSKLKEAFLKLLRFMWAHTTLCSIQSPRETLE